MNFNQSLRIAQAQWILLIFVFICNGQDRKPVVVEWLGSNCGEVAASVGIFAQGVEPGKAVIMIAYKGKGDSRQAVELQRLRTAKSNLVEYFRYAHNSQPREIIATVADGLSERGRLDYYLDRRLELQILFRKNAYLTLSCHQE